MTFGLASFGIDQFTIPSIGRKLEQEPVPEPGGLLYVFFLSGFGLREGFLTTLIKLSLSGSV